MMNTNEHKEITEEQLFNYVFPGQQLEDSYDAKSKFFRRLSDNKNKAFFFSMSWPTFFFCGLWLAYRRMFVIGTFLIPLCCGALYFLLFYIYARIIYFVYPNYINYSTPSPLGKVLIFFSFLICLFTPPFLLGLSANAIYLRHAKKRILKSQNGPYKGAGTNGWLIPLSIVTLIIFKAFLLFLIAKN